MTDALARSSDEVVAAVLAAAEGPASATPLRAASIAALAKAVDRPPPVGPLAQAMLLRDGSSAALRPLMPRFAQDDAPAWDVVRAQCPTRTSGLRSLADDPDPQVAQGAGAVLAYIRQFCVTSRPLGQ